MLLDVLHNIVESIAAYALFLFHLESLSLRVLLGRRSGFVFA